MASSALQTGGGPRGRPSRWTAAELRAWRLERGLKVAELAVLLGRPLSTTSKKINGHLTLTLDLDRQIENIEQLVRLGGVPAGSPIWLQARQVRGLGWDPHRRRRRS